MDERALPEHLIDTAIAWSIRLDHHLPTPEARADFERWLQADPQHAVAWQRVGALGHPFRAVPPQLVRDTLQTADGLRQRRRVTRRGAIERLSLAGVLLGAGWAAREHVPWQRWRADAATATGEQQTLPLADGSVLVLNTDTAVHTDLHGDRRVVVLRRGEIQVTTGIDGQAIARRPFWVATPFGEMRALGTRFTVRLNGPRARVSVQEGAVELHPSHGGATAIVRPGESRWLSADGSAPADLRGIEADAWTDGVIAGKGMRLDDLLAELARYRSGHIACDPRVAELRVSGLYHVQDTDRALQFLLQTQPISVVYTTRFWVSVGPDRSV
jgi:transmembrane sensor